MNNSMDSSFDISSAALDQILEEEKEQEDLSSVKNFSEQDVEVTELFF